MTSCFIAIITLTFLGSRIQGLPHGHRVICVLDKSPIYDIVPLFTLEDTELAFHMCTHLLLQTLKVNPTTYKVYSGDDYHEIGEGGYKKSMALKRYHKHLKIMMIVSDDSEILSEMCQNYTTRKNFIDSTIEFLQQYAMDGIEFGWYYPGNDEGKTEDKRNLALLSHEIRTAFDKHALLFSLAVPTSARILDLGFDAEALSQNPHFITVLTNELYGYYGGIVAPGSPLSSIFKDENDILNIEYGVKHLIKIGVNPYRLNLQISNTFGTYLLKNPEELIDSSIVGAQSIGTESFQGPNTRTYGSIAYYETCDELENLGNWTVINDSTTHLPFAVDYDRVISLENEETIKAKVKFVIDNKLGGVVFEGLDRDDVKGSCESSNGPFPFLRWIDNALTYYAQEKFEDLQKRLKEVGAHSLWGGLEEETITNR